jgi:hypothetical protein
MVGDRVATVGTGFPDLCDHSDEITEVIVFEHAGEFARGPKLRAGLIHALNPLESVAGGGGW